MTVLRAGIVAGIDAKLCDKHQNGDLTPESAPGSQAARLHTAIAAEIGTSACGRRPPVSSFELE